MGDAFQLDTYKIDMIYVIKSINAIKIGSSIDVRARLRQLRIGNPFGMTVIGVISGNRYKELEIHKSLQQYKIDGEWFQDCKPVRDKIKQLMPDMDNSDTDLDVDMTYINKLMDVSNKINEINHEINVLIGKKKVLDQRYLHLSRHI